MTESATTRQTENLQVRIAGWHLACRIAHWLDGQGYRFTQTDCANLHPGQYTGRPFIAAPDQNNQPRPWLVAWHPFPEPEPPKAQETPRDVRRFLAALEHTFKAAEGLGLALAGICLAALVFRLGTVLLAHGAPMTGFDQLLILAGLAAANALLFAAAGRIVPVLGHVWRWCQRRLGLWLLARSASPGM